VSAGLLAHTVKASNFGSHRNIGPFLARSVASSAEFCAKNDQNRLSNRKFVYNFDSIHLSVRLVFRIASPSEKQLQSSHEVQIDRL
jgi:hypothetical protein